MRPVFFKNGNRYELGDGIKGLVTLVFIAIPPLTRHIIYLFCKFYTMQLRLLWLYIDYRSPFLFSTNMVTIHTALIGSLLKNCRG